MQKNTYATLFHHLKQVYYFLYEETNAHGEAL